MIYHLYYFSATGNTEKSISMIDEDLKKAGHRTSVVRINRWTKPIDEVPDRIVLAFPTLAWRPPALVSRFIKKLSFMKKRAGRVKTAVLAVGAGGPLGAPDVAAAKIEKAGCNVFIRAVSNYVENWLQVVPAPIGEERRKLTERGLRMAGDFCTALLQDKVWTNYKKKPIFGIMSFIGILFELIGRRGLGKIFIADSKCNSCRLCEMCCPVNAILMGKGRNSRPFWKFNCESCNRCINICPRRAINSSIPRIIILVAFIILLFVAGIAEYSRYIQPLYSGLYPWLSVMISIAGYVFIAMAAHILPLTIIDILILRPLQAIKPLRKIMQISFTKNNSRYTFDGYKPPKEL